MQNNSSISNAVLIVAATALISGCTPSVVRDARDGLTGGTISVTINDDFQSVYRRISKFSARCYGQGASAIFYSTDRQYGDSREAEIILWVKGTLIISTPSPTVIVDIKGEEEKTTNVTVKYDANFIDAWKSWAEIIPYYAERDFSECPLVTSNPYKPIKPLQQ